MSDKIKLIDPYTNIALAEVAPTADDPATTLSSLRTLNVGQGGDNVFRADQNGIWAGSADFATAPFSVSMTGAVTASSFTLTGGTIRYGKTSFTDSVNAGYFMSALGLYFGAAADATKLKYTLATGALDYVGTISGLASITIAAAINSSGQFVNDLVNAKLNTSTKQILDSFSFGASGAIQIGTYSAGVSGDIRITPNGLVARNKSNQNTIVLDATTGDATFYGTLSAASGTLGTITSADITGGTITGVTITGGTMQTASGTGQRIVFASSDNSMKVYNSANDLIFYITTTSSVTTSITATAAGYSALQANNKSSLDYTAHLIEASITRVGSSGITAYFANEGTGDVLNVIASGDGRGIYVSHATDYGVYIQAGSVNTPSLYLKSAVGNNQGVIYLDVSANAAITGITFVLGGTGTKYAFDFQGNEYDATKTGVSTIMGVIKVNTSEGAGFIPVYSTAT